MHQHFFPNPVFGWTFYAVLLGFLVVASYTDLRWITIPKWLTVSMFGLGVLINLARGLWFGLQGQEVWYLPAGAGWGLLDGLLFALAGFAVSFAIFFVLWILGAVGGGDLKLFAALGAWVGPTYVVLLLLGAGSVVILLTAYFMVRKFFRKGAQRTIFGWKRSLPASGKGAKKGFAGLQPKDRHITYSLPVAIATAIMLLWFFRAELGLQPSPREPQGNVAVSARF